MIKILKTISIVILIFPIMISAQTQEKSAADILGNPEYLAISYGGYREKHVMFNQVLSRLKKI